MIKIIAACGSHIGKLRRTHQDNFYFDGIILPRENSGLDTLIMCSKLACQPVCFGVFDGMGGCQCGEEASFLAAVELKQSSCVVPETLPGLLHQMNKSICEKSRKDSITMGSTAIILCFQDEDVWLLNVGDSKGFIYRDCKLKQISVEHTDRIILESQGIEDRKPRLTQHLGIEPFEMIIEPNVSTYKTEPGDYFLICSDGLTDMVSEQSISGILERGLPVNDSVKELLSLALKNGGRDNITIILCEIKLNEL